MTTLNFPHQDDNYWIMIDVGGQKCPQYPSPLEVKMLIEEAVAEYKQFVLNVLDGIDIADGRCNTKAIRLALESRTITTNHQDTREPTEEEKEIIRNY